MSSRPRLDLTARTKKNELHSAETNRFRTSCRQFACNFEKGTGLEKRPSLSSNVENRPGFPSTFGFLDAEIVERDRFHVGALLMTPGIQELARGCRVQRISTVLFLDSHFADAQQQALGVFEIDNFLQKIE
jgi:hypothetical protein